MATHSEIIADIISLTNRPDLVAETDLALRTATRSAHLSDCYARDCQTTTIQLPDMTYVTQLDRVSLFPRLRSFSRVQLVDSNYFPIIFPPEQQIKIIELEDIFDSYGRVRNNVAYLAGTTMNIRTSILGSGFLITWFNVPALDSESFNSWIAEEYPELLIFWAASIVLGATGNESKAQTCMQLTQQVHLPYLRANYLLGDAR